MTPRRDQRGGRSRWAAIVVSALCGAWAALACGQEAGAPRGQGEERKLKAIWEPANLPEDIELKSVVFVSAEEGWVAGGKSVMEGGVVYHTADGGNSWELQLGDPQSSDRGFSDLRFVDATHGFAVQGAPAGGHRLFATSDGHTWVPSGTVPEHRRDYFFTTPTTGYTDSRNQILQTTDGGRTWEPVHTCRIRTEIQGLTREVDCRIERFFFHDLSLGYAISQSLPENAGNVLAKTEDGGATWKGWLVLPGERASEGSLWFHDAATGVFRTQDRKIFRTEDGGESWTESAGQAELKSNISFADREVGWMIRYRNMAYTANGGRSWLSREIAFPALVEDSSLPARDRGYDVGPHGMVYRYRVVPAEYTAKGMIAAPFLAAR